MTTKSGLFYFQWKCQSYLNVQHGVLSQFNRKESNVSFEMNGMVIHTRYTEYLRRSKNVSVIILLDFNSGTGRHEGTPVKAVCLPPPSSRRHQE